MRKFNQNRIRLFLFVFVSLCFFRLAAAAPESPDEPVVPPGTAETPAAPPTSLAAPEDDPQNSPPSEPPTAPPKPEISEWDRFFIEKDLQIARWFDGAADSIDLFLVGKRLTDKPNNTSVNIENSTFSREAESVNNTSSFNINLRLPNLEEYWQLKFTSYDEQEEARQVQNGYLRQNPRQRNLGASVGFFRKLGNIRTAFQPRVGLGSNPLKVSHSLSFESIVDYKYFQFDPRIEFYAKPDDGTGIFIRMNFNYVLTPIYSLTWTNEGEYKERLHLFTGTNGLSLGQFINDRNSMSYSVFLSSDNRPGYYLTAYSLVVSYSHLIYKKMLDVQFVPHLDFPADHNFRRIAGLTVNFNLYF